MWDHTCAQVLSHFHSLSHLIELSCIWNASITGHTCRVEVKSQNNLAKIFKHPHCCSTLSLSRANTRADSCVCTCVLQHTRWISEAHKPVLNVKFIIRDSSYNTVPAATGHADPNRPGEIIHVPCQSSAFNQASSQSHLTPASSAFYITVSSRWSNGQPRLRGEPGWLRTFWEQSSWLAI